MSTVVEDKAIALGHPSYVWRFGQERRLNLIRQYVPLENRRILDIGAGIGMYVSAFRRFSDDVFGVDVDFDRVRKARKTLPNMFVAPGEHLPFRDNSFDVVLLHEVIEHVDDDRLTVREAYRVTKPGGYVVIYAPNRLYFFETHGFYIGKRYFFRLLPLVNYLPDSLRRIFVPHARAYLGRDIHRLFDGLPKAVTVHTQVYPGFDNIIARRPKIGAVLRRILYGLEHTPLRQFGLSHFVVMRKLAPERLDYELGARLTAAAINGTERSASNVERR